MFSYHSDQMSQRSQVSRIALWGCSLNVFVIVYVFVIVFVYFIVFLLVRLCLLITPIKCLKVHKFLGMLSGSVCNNGHSLTYLLSDKVTYRAVLGTAKKIRQMAINALWSKECWWKVEQPNESAAAPKRLGQGSVGHWNTFYEKICQEYGIKVLFLVVEN